MAPVVHTPVKGFTGTIAGVNFADGVGETDDAAALLYFSGAGYDIRDDVPPAGTPLTEDESARVAASEAAPDSNAVPPQSDPQGAADSDKSDDGEQSDAESTEDEQEQQEQSERPHPVQGSKAVWFEHLSKLNPGHGFDLETVSRKELIAAVEAIEAKQA